MSGKTLKKGDIVLAPFPFTDLSQSKLRPAVILWVSSTGSQDTTICFISSQNLTDLKPEELLISDSDPEFKNTGLKVSSKVVVSRLVTLDRNLITRRIGYLGINQTKLLNTLLKEAFRL